MDALPPRAYAPPVPRPPTNHLPPRAFLHAIRTNALTVWPEAAYHEPIIVRRLLGRTNVQLADNDAIHHILVDNQANYRRSAASVRILRPITGQGLLLSTGDAWKLQRRTVAPALAPRVMPLLSTHILSAIGGAMERAHDTAGQPLDMLSFMQTLALDIAGQSMFSLETKQYGPDMRRLLAEFAARFAHPTLFDMILPPNLTPPRDWARNRFSKRWMHLIETMMERRAGVEGQPEQPRDLFDLLRNACDPETGAGFSPAELRDQVATLILAGHETTAVTMFWACMLLAHAPDVQEWLAEETAAIDPASSDALARLVRTRAVVNETLRLFPAAPVLVRESIMPDRFGALEIPRRALIMIAPWVLHRHHAFWSEPETFQPGRFMPGAPARPRYAFMPFGGGPRICVGAQFAMAEAILVLASVTRRFRIAMESSRPVMPVAIVTTQPDHAPPFRLTPR